VYCRINSDIFQEKNIQFYGDNATRFSPSSYKHPFNLLINFIDQDGNCTVSNTTFFQLYVAMASHMQGWTYGLVGLGLTTRFFVCAHHNPALADTTMFNFYMLNINFGNTKGVTESYYLFQKRMNFIHKRHYQLFEDNQHFKYFDKSMQPFVIYPTSESVGDEGHRRLLLNFASMWATFDVDTKKSKSIIVQPTKFVEYAVPNTFWIVPDVSYAITSPPENQTYFWYFPTTFAAISGMFKSASIEYRKLTHFLLKYLCQLAFCQ